MEKLSTLWLMLQWYAVLWFDKAKTFVLNRWKVIALWIASLVLVLVVNEWLIGASAFWWLMFMSMTVSWFTILTGIVVALSVAFCVREVIKGLKSS